MKKLLRQILRFALYVTAGLLLVVAVLAVLLRLGLPFLSAYKGDVESWVSSYLEAPVEIGNMDLAWSGLSPSITLDRVALQNSDKTADSSYPQQLPLRFDQMVLKLDLFASLFDRSLKIHEVSLSGVALSLEYTGNRRFVVAGSRAAATAAGDVSQQASPSSTQADSDTSDSGQANRESLALVNWLFNAQRVSLLDARVNLLDKQRSIDYQFDNLDVHARNHNDQHEIEVSVKLPEQLGEDLILHSLFNGTADNLPALSGSFSLYAESLQLQQWMALWPQKYIELTGRSDFTLSGDFDGSRLLGLAGEIQASDLVIESQSTDDTSKDTGTVNPLLVLQKVRTDLGWQRMGDGWQAQLKDVQINDGLQISKVDKLLLQKTADQPDPAWSVAVSGQALHLSPFAQLADVLKSVPVTKGSLDTLAALQVQGALQDFDIAYQYKSGDTAPHLHFNGEIANISSRAIGRIPGVANLSGRARITDGKGRVQLTTRDFSLRHLRLYPKPLQIAQINGILQIDLSNRQAFIQSDNLLVKDRSALLAANMSLGYSESDRLFLNLQSRYEVGDLTDVHAYVPAGRGRDRLINWLQQSIQGGRIQEGTLFLEGHLHEFPYTRGQGVLLSRSHIVDGNLKFRSNWPAVTDAQGTLYFDGPSMRFAVDHGRLGAVSLSRAEGFIDSLWKPVFNMTGAVTTDVPTLLRFAQQGPLQRILNPVLAGVTGQGSAEVNVDLIVPLRARKFREENEVFRVGGNVYLNGADLASERFRLAMSDVTGAIGFTEAGVEIKALDASLFGEHVDISASTSIGKAGKLTRVKASALAHASKVLESYEVPVADFFTGPSAWQMELTVPHSNSKDSFTRLDITSDLIGTEVMLPVPLEKSSGRERPISVTGFFKHDGKQIWDIKQGSVKMRAHVHKDVGMDSLSVFFGDGPLKEHVPGGIYVAGNADALSFDGWIRAIAQIIGNLSGEGDPAPIKPTFANIDVANMLVGNTAFGDMELRINTDEAFVNSVISNRILRGNLRYPRVHWRSDSQAYARIDNFDYALVTALLEADDDDVSSAYDAALQASTDRTLDPRDLPAMNLEFNQIVFPALTLTNVGVRTVPDELGQQIAAFGFAYDAAQLVGDGVWHVKDAQKLNPALASGQHTRLNLLFQSNGLGQSFDDVGMSGVLAGGHGSVRTTLTWDGPLYKPDLNSLDGESEIALKDGQILTIEPGAARLVGLLAFQELPRRLSLDFRDLTNDGLDFKRLDGKVIVDNGIAEATNLILEGPVGVIEVSGTTDLVAREFDQTIQVLPRVSAALPVLGILSGGATAGIGALLATPMLKALGIDFDRLGLTEYTLKGDWNEPVLEKISQQQTGTE